ncbi:MAG: serine/threonine protein kinase, partial [Actinomycetota bacterium]|nr:serine/threonine protein kinase [Actinomycetota bacterium]
MDSAPRRIADRYELRNPLGRGGMGVVWLAEDTTLQRRVAVKEVAFLAALDAREREAGRARVMREARAAARLNHPNVTAVYDVVQDEGRAWIVMELVDAPTLADLVARDGPLDPPRAAAIGLAVLDALEAAHAEGIVHRDVKPGNVMVAASGRVKLTDFGVAAVQGDPKITMTGLIVGSPSYMAPEQAREGEATPATDLWGLGATLYYAVEATPPFDRGHTMATLNAVVHEPPRPPTRAGALAPVVSRLLAKDPGLRPAGRELR